MCANFNHISMNIRPSPDSPEWPSSAKSRESIAGGRIGVPDGGLRAWLVVAGGFINFFVAFGFLNAFGTFQALYELSPSPWANSNATHISWIGGSQHVIFFLGGLVVGPVFDKWGARPPLCLGALFSLASFLGTSYSTKMWHVIVCQGVFFGIADALIFYPTASAISEWFDKNRAVALGIAVSGSSLGGICWPFILEPLFEHMSVAVLHQTLASISTPLLLLACVIVRQRRGVAGHDTSGNWTNRPQRSLMTAILDWRFLMLCCSLLFLFTGLLIPFNFISKYAVDNRIHASMAYDFLPVIYGGSFLGRIGTGCLADRFGRFNVTAMVTALVAALIICWIWIISYSAQAAFAFLFGMLSRGLIPLGSACVAQTTPDMGHIGLRNGVMMAICSVGAMGGTPLAIAVLDASGKWEVLHVFTAGICLLGGLLIMLSKHFWQTGVLSNF